MECKQQTITQYLKDDTKKIIKHSELNTAMNDRQTERITIVADKSYNHENCIHVRSGTGEYYTAKFNTKFEF